LFHRQKWFSAIQLVEERYEIIFFGVVIKLSNIVKMPKMC